MCVQVDNMTQHAIVRLAVQEATAAYREMADTLDALSQSYRQYYTTASCMHPIANVSDGLV
jgi:hypothetical protein